MTKKVPAYIITGIALVGIVIFSYYNDTQISYKRPWLIISAIVFLIGLYIAATARTKKEIIASAEYLSRRNQLISTGEQIKLDIDACDIKENNYYEEISNQGAPDVLQSIDAEFDPNENYREKYVDQSAIIYYHKIGGTSEKFISQPFPMSTEALTFHILNNDIILYVDRFNRSNYLFELQTTNT